MRKQSEKLGINTISNIATKLWSMVSIYLFIPLYIQILGETAYGLVSFFATLQTTLNILGLGLSNTLRREFASGENTYQNAIRKYKLLRSTENIYFVLGIVVILICSFGSEFIANNWLNIETLNFKQVSLVISLMGVSIAIQMIANLYSGCLFGLNYQALANIICILWSAAKSIGALFVIAFLVPNLTFFYGWHIITDILYLIALRWTVKKKLQLIQRVEWNIRDFSNMLRILRYTCGVLFISFIALINKQLDKIVISRFFTLTELGAYNVATTLGSLSTIVPIALYTTVFPRFTNYVTTNKKDSLEKEFLKINRLSNLTVACMGAFIAVYALPLIRIWTGSDSYARILGSVGTLVVLAVSIAEFQEIPYALALANGNTKYNVFVGIIFIPIVFASTYWGIVNYGLIGAGCVYLLMMVSQTLVYEWLVYKKYLRKNPFRLIICDTFLPLAGSLIIACISKNMIENITDNIFAECGLAIVCGGLTLLFLFLLFGKNDL